MRWFFAEGRPERLRVARSVFYASVLLLHFRTDFATWGRVGDVFWRPVGPPALLPRAPATLLVAMEWAFRASLLLAATGVGRWSARVLASLLGAYLLALPSCFGRVYHFDGLVALLLLVMACTREREQTLWAERTARSVYALVLFAAGVAKLRASGLAWADGERFGWTLVREHYAWPNRDPVTDLGLAIARNRVLCSVLAAGVLATETLFPLALFLRPARRLLLPASAALVIAIRLVMGPTFEGFLCAYAFWIPWERLLRREEPGSVPSPASIG